MYVQALAPIASESAPLHLPWHLLTGSGSHLCVLPYLLGAPCVIMLKCSSSSSHFFLFPLCPTRIRVTPAMIRWRAVQRCVTLVNKEYMKHAALIDIHIPKARRGEVQVTGPVQQKLANHGEVEGVWRPGWSKWCCPLGCYGVSLKYGVSPFYGVRLCFGVSPCYSVSLCYVVSRC